MPTEQLDLRDEPVLTGCTARHVLLIKQTVSPSPWKADPGLSTLRKPWKALNLGIQLYLKGGFRWPVPAIRRYQTPASCLDPNDPTCSFSDSILL